MASLFLKLMGDNPRNRILDFFIVSTDWDYSLKEIAKNSKVGYSTVKLIMPDFVKAKWIVPRRKISKIKLYHLNKKNPDVVRFVNSFWDQAGVEIRRMYKERPQDFYTVSPKVAVSVRNV